MYSDDPIFPTGLCNGCLFHQAQVIFSIMGLCCLHSQKRLGLTGGLGLTGVAVGVTAGVTPGEIGLKLTGGGGLGITGGGKFAGGGLHLTSQKNVVQPGGSATMCKSATFVCLKQQVQIQQSRLCS